MSLPILKSEPLFQGKIFNVVRDEVQAPDGRIMQLDVVQHHGAVAFIPVDHEGRIWLVRQYRHPAGRTLLEIPAGTLEPGEEPETCAIRECRQEIGMAPGSLTYLGGAFLAPGYSSEYLHFFLASDLTPAPLDPDADEDLQVVQMTSEEMRTAIREGKIIDGKTLAALTLMDLSA